MKILHISKKYSSVVGGDAVVVANLEKQQKKAGERVIILTSNCDEIKDSPHIYKFGFRDNAAALDKITPKRIVSLIMLFFQSYKILKKEKPDIIHTHSVDMAFFISFAARRYRIPIIHSFHCVTFNDPQQSFLRRKSELPLLRFASPDKIFLLNPADIGAFEKAGFDNAMFMPNGINMEEWSKKNFKRKSTFTFIAVGRLEHEKGFIYLIEAAAQLQRTHSNFQIQIVGNGALKNQLSARIHSLGVEKQVVLLGSRKQKELRELYTNADAFVMPSLSEGMPIVLLEAWAAALPTIVTDVKGIPYISEDASRQVKAGDATELKRVMKDLMEDTGLAQTLASKGYNLVKSKYQWNSVSKKIQAIYRLALMPRIMHIADFVPPYLEGGGGGAISTTKNIEFLSKHSQYYILTRKHQDKPWLYANAKIYPVLPKIIITPKSLGQMIHYIMTNSSVHAYKRRVKKYQKLLKPDLIYITGNCLPLMRAALKTKVPTFIDVRDDYFNDPIMSRRVPKEKNQFVYLYRHVTERHLIPNGLKLFTIPLVIGFLLHAKLQRFLLRLSIINHTNTYFIALSNYINLKLVEFGVPVNRIVTIYNSADINSPKKIHKPAERNNEVVFAGIIERTKGVWTILAAAEKLRQENFNFVLIGDGPELNAVKQHIRASKLKNVKLTGKLPHDEVIERYSKARVILGPSVWPEPFGRFIQESIATQTPLVAARVGGVPEGIKDKQTGLLINSEDADRLAHSIKQLFEDKKLYRQIYDNLLTLRPVYGSERLGMQRLNYMLERSSKQL